MTPEMLKLTLDLATLLAGVYAMLLARKSAIGGMFAKAMTLILLGIFILTVNHALDTLYLASALKNAGHTKDYLQGPIVHRMINFIGFLLMVMGFAKLAETGKK